MKITQKRSENIEDFLDEFLPILRLGNIKIEIRCNIFATKAMLERFARREAASPESDYISHICGSQIRRY